MSDPKPVRLEERTYTYKSVTIRVWKCDTPMYAVCPWRYSIQQAGSEERLFLGVPNYGESWRESYMRALHRARWLDSGNWSKHYS